MAEEGARNLMAHRNISSIKTIILMGQTGTGTVGWMERLCRNVLSGVFAIGRLIKMRAPEFPIAEPDSEARN